MITRKAGGLAGRNTCRMERNRKFDLVVAGSLIVGQLLLLPCGAGRIIDRVCHSAEPIGVSLWCIRKSGLTDRFTIAMIMNDHPAFSNGGRSRQNNRLWIAQFYFYSFRKFHRVEHLPFYYGSSIVLGRNRANLCSCGLEKFFCVRNTQLCRSIFREEYDHGDG